MSKVRVVSKNELSQDPKTRTGSNAFGSYTDAVENGTDSLMKMKDKVRSKCERRVSFSPLTN